MEGEDNQELAYDCCHIILSWLAAILRAEHRKATGERIKKEDADGSYKGSYEEEIYKRLSHW